jgi:hypothetical protein
MAAKVAAASAPAAASFSGRLFGILPAYMPYESTIARFMRKRRAIQDSNRIQLQVGLDRG